MDTRADNDGNVNVNDIPHAVPAVVDYHPNKNAGQPIRSEPRASPQTRVTGYLADDACSRWPIL